MADHLDAPFSDVRCDVEDLDRWRRRLTLHVPHEIAERSRQTHVQAFARRARIKGFRPGKAPADRVHRQYRDEIETEVLKDTIQAGFEAAVEQNGLEPIAPPQVDNVRWTPDGALEFVAEVDIKPEIELGRTGGFRIKRRVRRISDGDVDRVLERLQIDRADWLTARRAAVIGDRVVFDSVPLDDEGHPLEAERVEDHVVELGSGALLPEFEAGLQGLSAGEATTLDVAFPEDHPNEALRGRARRFSVEVDEVKERALPELDDEFARMIGDFDSLDGARNQIRSNLEEEAEQQSLREVNEGLIDAIIEANRLDLPESMIERYLTRMMADPSGPLGGQFPDEREQEMREILRPGAERAMRRYYILQYVAEREGLGASDEEVDAAIEERIDASQTTVAEMRRRLERSGELDDLRFHLSMERVFEWLREQSRIKTVKVDAEDGEGAD